MDVFSTPRNSFMEFDKIYFWTATLHKWKNSLMPNAFKETITDSLAYLSELEAIDVFGFVIMPNPLT